MWELIALAKRALLRNPLLRTLIIFIRLLSHSAGPMLTLSTIAFNIPHRFILIVLASSWIGVSRLHTAHESHCSEPLRAQVLLT